MSYDVIVIGAGLSGLSAASLLSKRGLRVLVIDKIRAALAAFSSGVL